MNLTKEQEIYAQVVQKCWEDASFKQELIDNPVETLEKFSGKSLNIPEGKTLIVRDQTDGSAVYINIPRKVENMEPLGVTADGMISENFFDMKFINT